MQYFMYLGVFFPSLFFLYAVFGSSIGHLNYILWKNSSKRPKQELNGWWSISFIPKCGMNDKDMIYETNWAYKITFQLMVAFYILTAIITLVVIAGFIVVSFFDNLGLLLLIVCVSICCVSYLILYIIIVYHKSLAYKNK